MDKNELYKQISDRKIKPQDYDTYAGDNGRVNKCADLVKAGRLKSGGTLLDVGGGIGDLGLSLKGHFEHRIVLDISAINLEAAASKGNAIIVSDVDKDGLNVCDNSVDLVAALDFIEHIIDPEFFARECFRVLKSDGQVFINTPNFQHFRILENLIHKGHFTHTSGDKEIYHGGHLGFYVFEDMEKIFSSSGFKNVEQIKDEEGYSDPPQFLIDFLFPKTQKQYVDCCMHLGNPNLLFKCEKPE